MGDYLYRHIYTHTQYVPPLLLRKIKNNYCVFISVRPVHYVQSNNLTTPYLCTIQCQF